MRFAILAQTQSISTMGWFCVATLTCNESSQLVLLIEKLSSPLKYVATMSLLFIVYGSEFHRLPMCCVRKVHVYAYRAYTYV